MALDGVETELAHVPVENGKKESVVNGHVSENESGTHVSESVRVETAPEPSFPKDAVEDWPVKKEPHYFYFVKYRTVEDQNVKAKLEQADKELRKLNQARDPINEQLKAKRTERAQVISQLKTLQEEKKQKRTILDGKRKEMEPYKQALEKLKGTGNSNRDNKSYICSSEEELNDNIKSMQYHIQHESITLKEEKQIIKEIKNLEATRGQVIAKAAMRAEVQKSVGEKDAIQDQVKLIGVDLDVARKDQQAVQAKVKTLEAEKEAINRVIDSLDEEWRAVGEKRDKVYDKIRGLRNERDEGNRSLLNNARMLAANKDVDALIELSTSEVDKFMSEWNTSKAFREDYEKRILHSLDMRQLSKDGRTRIPGEKPLISPELPTPVPVETEVVAKPKAKQPKEDPVPPPVDSVEKEKDGKKSKEANGTIKGKKEKIVVEEEEVFALEKKPVKAEVDESKLKEIKREEEIAKAKQALERKKKLAEKAAVKAQKKAEKEAEKKLKEKEKKEKKKMQVTTPAVEVPEEAAEEEAVEEPEEEKAEEKVKTTIKSKERKDGLRVRSRGNRGKGPDSISKVILKRKKSNNYMYYYAAAAASIVVVLLAVGYNLYA